MLESTKFFTKIGLAILLMTPLSALAEEPCDDLWFARNTLMNDAGYCFKSNLGKAIFDNSDCHTAQPKLSSRSRAWVKEIQETERLNECEVNTTKKTLNIINFTLRKRLGTQPINDGLESSCIGYKGTKKISVYSDISVNSVILGFIEIGDDIGFSHVVYENFPSNWSFISAVDNLEDTKTLLGWINNFVISDKICTTIAG